ncbi:hypothetical protein [Longimicrobium sp.]|uniref:hypothetical protein n=1 Tax=Longimicrobium sp. TaxID=2029185 RepID=UPI002BA475CF|nr:hypothetical protein [Longimicrobium sp.]HSU16649.1 hypothetical protein [Longimicrobium sp.]
MTKTLIFPALLALSALAARPLSAQGTAVDAGTFRVSVEGREVGTETFSITQSGSGGAAVTLATGTVDLRLNSGALRLAPRLRGQGVAMNPAQYQVDVSGDSPQRIVGNIGSGRVSARIVTAAGEQLREYVATAGAVVLDDAVAHHYYFLAQRLHSGTVPVIIPRESRQMIAAVTDRGEETVQVAGGSARLFHLVVQPRGGPQADVWVDALNRVIRVDIPARQYSAVRTELPR